MSTSANFFGFGKAKLDESFQYLRDNINKEISPEDVRSSLLTIWGNIPFKVLGTSGQEYISIDSTSYSNYSALNKKIYLGNGSGVYSNGLNSKGDLFLVNNGTSSSTKVVIVGGTTDLQRQTSPVFEAIGNGNKVDLKISNDSSIAIETNTLVLNGLSLSNNADSFNNKYLKVENGTIVPGEPTNGSGTLNPDDLIYTNPNPTLIEIGGIPVGTDFSGGISYKELFDMLLYPYVPPKAELSLTQVPNYANIQLPRTSGGIFIEKNNLSRLDAVYSATKRTYDIQEMKLVVNNVDNAPIVGTQPGTVAVNPFNSNSLGLNDVELVVYDTNYENDTNSFGSKKVVAEVVLPYIVGVSTTRTKVFSEINSLINSPNSSNSKFDFYLNNRTNTDFRINTAVGGNVSNKCIYILVNAEYGTPDILYYATSENDYLPLVDVFMELNNVPLTLTRWNNVTNNYKVYVYTNDGTTPAVTNINEQFRLRF